MNVYSYDYSNQFINQTKKSVFYEDKKGYEDYNRVINIINSPRFYNIRV